MLAFRNRTFAEMIGHAYDGYPLEACGLLVGRGDASRALRRRAPTRPRRRGSTRSPRRSCCAPSATPRTTGLEIIGVFHSHTHTEPYPSPTDVDQAPDPELALRDRQLEA